MTDIRSRKTTAHEVLAALGHGERVAVVGSINADLVVETKQLPCPEETIAGGPLETLPGGKSTNQAVTYALLGTATSFIGTPGDDARGDLFYQSLRHAGVDTAGVNRVNQPSEPTLTTVDSHGKNTTVYPAGANAMLNAASVAAQTRIIQGTQVLGLYLESSLEAVAAAATIAREAGVTMALNLLPITKVPDFLLRLVDVLIVNEHELAVLAGRPLDSGGAAGLRTVLNDLGFERAILTLGTDSTLALEGGGFVSIPPFAVAAVDTTGYRDTFMGSLLAAVAAGKLFSRGACLASAVVGVAALRKGAQTSYRNAREVREFLDFS